MSWLLSFCLVSWAASLFICGLNWSDERRTEDTTENENGVIIERRSRKPNPVEVRAAARWFLVAALLGWTMPLVIILVLTKRVLTAAVKEAELPLALPKSSSTEEPRLLNDGRVSLANNDNEKPPELK